MGIDEFEKNLEKKIEQERDAERQRMLRELKYNKVKNKESMVVLQDEAKVNKRNQKAEEKEAAKNSPEEEDMMRKWGSAPANNTH